MKRKMIEKIKDVLYSCALGCARIYWRVVRPTTFGARVILISNNKVLLVQPRRARYWNLPGGGIKKNETPEQGALRELYEETGIHINKTDYILGTYYSQREGKRDTVTIVVVHTDSTHVPKLEIEIQQAVWFPWDQLPETVTRPTRWRIEEYLHNLKDIKGDWLIQNSFTHK